MSCTSNTCWRCLACSRVCCQWGSCNCSKLIASLLNKRYAACNALGLLIWVGKEAAGSWPSLPPLALLCHPFSDLPVPLLRTSSLPILSRLTHSLLSFVDLLSRLSHS